MNTRNHKGQFRKGHSGNPGGRPKGNLTSALRNFMDDIDYENGLSRIEMVTKILYKLACEGDLSAIKLIFERVDGKPKQYIENQYVDRPIKVLQLPEDFT
tara:strand:+ start:187 stop:486 length:300 start_codon:yes stop_codon:yes gene_type:complete